MIQDMTRMARLDPQVVQRFWRRLGPLPRDGVVLDLGCGDGSMARGRPSSKLRVVGIDFDSRAVALAAKDCVETFACDVSESPIPLADSSVDGVIAKDIIEHVPRTLKLMLDIRRVMKPGTRLVLSVPMEFGRVVWGDYTHHRGFTERALRQLALDADLEVMSIDAMGGGCRSPDGWVSWNMSRDS